MSRKFTLDEETVLSRSGIADPFFADHSGDIQHGYQLGSLTEGLVAYYPMEEGQGQVLHDGALDNLGQIEGASWNGSGQVGSDALNFSDVSDAVVSENSVINPVNEFTASLWLKLDTLPSSVGSDYAVLSQKNGSGTGRSIIFIDDADDNIKSFLGATNSSSNHTLGTGSWTNVIVTYSSNLKFYINGSLSNTANISPESADGSMVIGASKDESGEFDGQIDDVRIYDRALSQPEIEALYALTEPSGEVVEERDLVTYPDPEAIARYEFEGDVTDSWGDNDGTDNTSAGYVDGVYGQAKDFDGSDDYINISSVSLSDSESFTLTIWVKPEDTDFHRLFAQLDNDAYNLEFGLQDASNNQGYYFAVGQNGGNELIVSSGTYSTDEWVHISGVYDSVKQSIKLYKNGSIIASDSGPVDYTPSSDMWIGARSDSFGFTNGAIDDARIYDRALDPIEVEQLFNKGAYRINRSQI